MSESTPKNTKAASNPLPNDGDHDRVSMLSVKANGEPDQHNPEIIGDKDVAAAATAEQFKQQAVSAADADAVAERRGGGTVIPDAPQDPAIEAEQKLHADIASGAVKRAQVVVDELHRDGK